MPKSKRKLVKSAALVLPAIIGVGFVGHAMTASADIGPIPFPIDVNGLLGLGGPAAGTPVPTTSPTPTPSVSVAPSISPSPSPSVSMSPSPTPSLPPLPSATPTIYKSPILTQQNGGGTVTFTVRVDPHYTGLKVYFFLRSGMTGKVVPLGTTTIGDSGFGFRNTNAKRGRILAVYSKIIGAASIKSPYSNDVQFKMN